MTMLNLVQSWSPIIIILVILGYIILKVRPRIREFLEERKLIGKREVVNNGKEIRGRSGRYCCECGRRN